MMDKIEFMPKPRLRTRICRRILRFFGIRKEIKFNKIQFEKFIHTPLNKDLEAYNVDILKIIEENSIKDPKNNMMTFSGTPREKPNPLYEAWIKEKEDD